MNEADAVTGSLSELLGALVSSGQGGPDAMILLLLIGCGLALVATHGAVAVRLIRIARLERDIAELYESRSGGGREGLLRDLDRTFAGSLLADTWSELLRRRRELEAHAPADRAAVRLADLFAERPLVPRGVRRQAMRVLPGFLAALGVAASLGLLAGGLTSGASQTPLAAIIGGALRGAFWGVVAGAVASALTAILEGAADRLSARLSQLVERSYRSLTPLEAQLRGAEAQRLGFERVSSLLVQVAQDLRDSLDRGLGRIERSTASAANLVGEEQRRILELVIDDLSGLLRRGVEEHVGALRDSLTLAAEQQATLGDRVASTIEQVTAGAEGSVRVSGALERAAQAVDDAAGTIAGSADELKPLIVHFAEVASTLERAAARVDQAQSAASGEDTPSARMLTALRDDVALIGAQFLEGATALRRSVEPFTAREAASPTNAPNVAEALDDLDARTGALRHRLGDVAASDEGSENETPREVEAPESALRTPTDLLAEDGAGTPGASSEPTPAAASAVRRGGDLASALARSGEQLGGGERREPAGEAGSEDRGEIEVAAADGSADSDLEAVGRGGFSALLSRYKAPQFSIDELPPDLREFDVDEAERRARHGGGKAEPANSDETEVLDPSADTPTRFSRAEERERPSPDAPGISEQEAERRRRLNRFLGSE